MNTLSRFLTIAGMAIMFCACASSSSPEAIDANLDHAEAVAADGDYRQALELSNRMATSPDTAAFSARQYCRLAMIFATVADNITDNESAMASAVSSLCHALSINPDTVAAYINELDVTRNASMQTTLQLIHGANIDISKYTDGEDVIIEDHDIDPDSLHSHE